MKVRYTPQAGGDIDRIYSYLEQRSPSGAAKVATAIYAGIRFVAEWPEASERTNDPNVRVKLVRRYQYKIFYRLAGDVVEILHVRHMSRAPWKGER